MHYTKRVEIAAPPAQVWAVLADIGHWPSWTPTVTALDADGPDLQRGRRVRITQPGLRPTTYTVTEVDDGRRFVWEARGPGLRQRADHEVEASGDQSQVTLAFAVDGPVGRLISPFAGSTIRRMVDTEADALRRRVEHGAADGRGHAPGA